MRWHARVISGLTVDTEPSIEVSLDESSSKYIFNCGEGTTRACMEHKRGLRKVKGVFLTRINTQQSGGLAGLIMSLADTGVPDVQFYGPVGLSHYVASMRHYSKRDVMSVSVNEIHPKPPGRHDTAPTPDFSDGHLSVYAVPITPFITPPLSPSLSVTSETSTSSLKRKRDSSPTTPSKRSNDGNDLNESLPGDTPFDYLPGDFRPMQLRGADADAWRRLVVQSMFKPSGGVQENPGDTNQPPSTSGLPSTFSSHSWKRLPPAGRSAVAISYVGVGPPIRGKFDAQRAKELGLPNGPIRAQLARGETVTTPSGVTITPEMCIGPPIPPLGFFFVDCPNLAYVPNITSSPAFDPRRYGENISIHFIIHRTGAAVLEDAQYRSWMSSFGPLVHHIIASEPYCSNQVVFNSSSNYQLLLSKLDADIFQPPHESLQPLQALSSLSGLPSLSQVIHEDMVIGMIPVSEPQRASFGLQDRYYPLLESMESPAFRSPFEEEYTFAQDLVRICAPENDSFPGSDVLITTLGTGSALPSKYRNVSATLIQIPKWGNILLDCGEGTWGQMARRFGIADSGKQLKNPDALSVLRDLKCIFLSHIHGDHHMGVCRLLAKRKLLNLPPNETLTIIGNNNTLQYLHEYDELEDIGLSNDPSIQILDSEYLVTGSNNAVVSRPDWISSKLETLNSNLGLKEFQAVEVIHRAKCFGCVIRHIDGWSVVFSGDTMPCDNLVDAGKGATLLIHEATMADDEAELAEIKAHSTFGQAIDVGRRMNAQNILLTHFSQRYPKIPVLQQAGSAPDPILELGPSPKSIQPTSAPVALAFDCATIPIGSMWKMQQYTRAITKTFEDVNEIGEDGDDILVELTPEMVIKVEGKSKGKREKKLKS